MHHPSKLSVALLPPVLVPLLVLAAGVLIGKAEPWGSSLSAIVYDIAWCVLCAALVALVLLSVARVARELPSANDDDEYYRRPHF